MNLIPFANVSDVSVLAFGLRLKLCVSPISMRAEPKQTPKQSTLIVFISMFHSFSSTHLMWFKSAHRFSYRTRAHSSVVPTICWHLKPHKLSYLLSCYAPAHSLCVWVDFRFIAVLKPKADNANTLAIKSNKCLILFRRSSFGEHKMRTKMDTEKKTKIETKSAIRIKSFNVIIIRKRMK